MRDCDKYAEMISAYIDAELCYDDSAELMRHVHACDECRKLMEAFSGISEGFEILSAPAELSGSVMNAINLSGKAKKRRRLAVHAGRYAAIAACSVLVVYSATRLYALIPANSGGASTANEQLSIHDDEGGVSFAFDEYAEKPETYISEAQSGTGEGSEDQKVDTSTVPSATPITVPEPTANTFMQGLVGQDDSYRGTDALLYMNKAVIYNGDDTEADPLTLFTDPELLSCIALLLTWVEDSDAAAPDTPNYTLVTFTDADMQKVFRIWNSDGDILCQAEDGALFKAAGTFEALSAFFRF